MRACALAPPAGLQFMVVPLVVLPLKIINLNNEDLAMAEGCVHDAWVIGEGV